MIPSQAPFLHLWLWELKEYLSQVYLSGWLTTLQSGD